MLVKTVAVLLMLVGTGCGDDSKRTVTAKMNPNCPETICDKPLPSGSYPNTLYLRSANSTDVIHMVVSSVRGISLMVGHQPGPDGDLKVDWQKLVNQFDGAFTFTGKQGLDYLFVATLKALVEYDDPNDEAVLSSGRNITYHDMSSFVWENAAAAKLSHRRVYLRSNLSTTADFLDGGNLQVGIRWTTDSESRADELPKLLVRDDSFGVELILNHLKPKFKSSRFATEWVISNGQPGRAAPDYGLEVHRYTSIDDEYTPGVFELVDIPSKQSGPPTAEPLAGFIQYKPVIYLEPEKKLQNQSKTSRGQLVHLAKDIPESLSQAVAPKRFAAVSVKISFGAVNDGFYKFNNYTSWSFSMGFGAPPTEGLSLMVVLIISVGVGLPTIIIVCGMLFMFFRRDAIRARMASRFQPIN